MHRSQALDGVGLREIRGAALAALVLLAAGIAQAAGDRITAQVLEDTGDRIVLTFSVDAYDTAAVEIDGAEYVIPRIAGEASTEVAGAPDLPRVRRSVTIDGDALMVARVLDARYEDQAGVDVAPSKGSLPRTVNPKDVPYTFGAEYAANAFYPADVVALGEPYLLRRQRGVVVEFNPFRYNPVTHTLRVCRSVTLVLVRAGVDTRNVLPAGRAAETSRAFDQIHAHHFLNYTATSRYTPLEETGSMLIIANDAWITNVQPLAAHHTAGGIPTTVVGVSTIGNTSTAIKNYLQNVYNTTDLTFVLLVGDATQVATPSASGGSSDPSYAKLAGSDNYPDILIGRFSAETAAQVDTQVARTLYYEQTPVYDLPWYHRATGIASLEGPGDDDEYDNEHMDNIRTDLLAYGYTPVDQLYGSATASQVASALNAGRGLVCYTGHGSTTSWGTTGFSNSNVSALTNTNMLPFIFDVACVNGQFSGYTCFAEAWMRASYNGLPTGAVGIYASSINQDWDPPMCAQDAFVDLLVAEGYVSVGALCFAGSCQMMDEYGTSGVNMYNTWHLFGDPALKIRFDGPFQPQAARVDVSTQRNAPVDITLLGSDGDGDPLDYIVLSLPLHGTLATAGGTAMTTAPYTLPGKGNGLRYTPATGYIGDDSFLYRVNDGTPPPDGGDSATAVVQIVVQALPPAITTAALPDGAVDQPYGPFQLACDEGQPPLSWAIVSEVDYLANDLGANEFAAVGQPRNWHGDDIFKDYALPFAFPFYGVQYTSVRVYSNGFLNFGAITGSSYNNSTSTLKSNVRIAPLWDDLHTDCAGCDIYIDESVADEVTFRWIASTHTGGYAVNVSTTLRADGRITFDYGPGNTGLTATVGLSAGDGVRYTLAPYDGVTPLTDVDSLLFEQPNLLPPVMQVSPSGVLSGVPAEVGEFQPVFRVTDSLGRTDQVVLPLRVVEFALGNCDFNADGAVDLLDFAAFQRCFTGAGNGPAGAGCAVFNADTDGDIDAADYVRFESMLSE